MTAPLSDPLRAAAREFLAAGNTEYRLAKAAGVKPDVVTRWLSGERADLYLSTADKLAVALGVRVTASPQMT